MIVMAKTREMDRERNHSCCLAEQLGPRTIPSQCSCIHKGCRASKNPFPETVSCEALSSLINIFPQAGVCCWYSFQREDLNRRHPHPHSFESLPAFHASVR